MGAWQHGMSAICSYRSASKVVRTLKVAHGCKCQVAEHSKLDTPEDLKDLLKRVDDTLQQFDTVCGREVSGEDEDQLEMVIEGRQLCLPTLSSMYCVCRRTTAQHHTIAPYLH